MRAIFILFFGLAAANAMAADWQLVDHTDDGNKFYVDTSSIRVNGSMRRAWQLYNLGTTSEDGTRSGRALLEHDCREGRIRLMQLAKFSLPDATGKVTFNSSFDNGKWEYVAPGSVGESSFKFVCARK